MNIVLSDEQTQLLSEAVNAGVARSQEEAVDQALRAYHSSAVRRKPVHSQVDNLADLFARSPLRGLNIEFERDRDPDRDITL